MCNPTSSHFAAALMSVLLPAAAITTGTISVAAGVIEALALFGVEKLQDRDQFDQASTGIKIMRIACVTNNLQLQV